MTTYSVEEYAGALAQFDLDIISRLDPRDFVDFGVMDSRKYADKLFQILDANNLSTTKKTMVIVLAIAVKNKKRVINAMKKFQGADWYRPVLDFFRNACVQYTYEEEDDTFSVVHIPSSVPYLTARIWLQITETPTVESFLSNLWAAQLHLDDNLMSTQKVWETDFWYSVVTKGGNNFEPGKFNRDYWETKAKDKYLLINVDGSIYGNESVIAGRTPYNISMIKKWFTTKINRDVHV